MLADAVYDALRPFHLWAQIDAVCAIVLAASAFVLLGVSTRRSRRSWLGLGVVVIYLLAVALGERSRQAAGDLRPIAVYCSFPASGVDCGAWEPLLVHAAFWTTLLGFALVTVSVLCLIATLVMVLPERQVIANGWQHLFTHRVALAVTLLVAGLGAYLTADGLGAWVQYAYLADINRAGDALGQIPLISAVLGTAGGLAVLVTGLILILVWMLSHPRTAPAP